MIAYLVGAGTDRPGGAVGAELGGSFWGWVWWVCGGSVEACQRAERPLAAHEVAKFFQSSHVDAVLLFVVTYVSAALRGADAAAAFGLERESPLAESMARRDRLWINSSTH